ncbi:MAG: SpoIIE family protein phosphatase [Actinobacteria bacterium]|nr:SpoIIE family protein phosphatase [Actinomycetota bacterium]
MPPADRPRNTRPLGDLLLAPKGHLQRYRWVVLVIIAAVVVLLLLVVHWVDATLHPLAPVGAVVVFLSILAAGLGGVPAGFGVALVGVITALVLLADFNSKAGTVNAVVSALLWCGAASAAGLIIRYLRRQVARREAALEQALHRTLYAKEQIERVLEFSPQFYRAEDSTDLLDTVCASAMETFGADGARLFTIEGNELEIVALCPPSNHLKPGFTLQGDDLPELDDMIEHRRPSFIRDVRTTRLKGSALTLQHELNLVSTVRLPIFSPTGITGLLALGWDHAIERPGEDLLAIMQRFTDQAAIAWQTVLRAEAQRQADKLHATLERLVAMAPSFHITGSREEVARAMCEAALVTFDCTGAALYRIEGDRLRVLDRRPPLDSISPGTTFPLRDEMLLAHEITSHRPTFVADAADPSRYAGPWPLKVLSQVGVASAFYVPVRSDADEPEHLLILSWDKPRQTPDENVLVIVERFADQLALALTNASAQRLHDQLQASLLPSTEVNHPVFRVLTRYHTGEQRLKLGGDFVGAVPAPDGGLHFVIGDVSGHGPEAAGLGSTLRSTWKALALAGQGIPEIVDVMRRVLATDKTEPNSFVTLIVGRIDIEGRDISFVNAGHLPPLLITDKVISLEGTPAAPLGFDSGTVRVLSSFPLPRHWSMFCYTDGLTDARVAPGASERFGEDRLKQRLTDWTGPPDGSRPAPDGAAVDALMTEIETAGGGHFADDVAILLISTKDEEYSE